jgi:hypothetical protein
MNFKIGFYTNEWFIELKELPITYMRAVELEMLGLTRRKENIST